MPHVHIIGAHHCGNTCREDFKHHGYIQDVLFCSDYENRVVTSFSHQNQSEYYGRNKYVSIEVTALEHFSDKKQPLPLYALPPHTRNELFHTFLSDDIKQDDATTATYIKCIIEWLNN